MPKHDQVKDDALRGQLAEAHQKLRDRDPTAAVETLADTFVTMLRDHPELLEQTVPARGRRVPVVMRWPNLGANLVPDSVREGDPRIEFTRERFAVSEALTYYEFCCDTAVGAGL